MRKYQLPVEELPELIKQMDQIFNIPKTKHVMSSYVKTTGIVETECFYRNTQLRIFDTGGQRNERKKWVHLFSSTSAIVFIVSLSEYNQVCYEDDKSNRMKESLLLFEEIVNACCFEDVPIFLVFNKKRMHSLIYPTISDCALQSTTFTSLLGKLKRNTLQTRRKEQCLDQERVLTHPKP